MLQVTICDSFHNRFSWGYSQNKGSGDSLFFCLVNCLFVCLFFVVKQRDKLYLWKFEIYFRANTLLLRGRCNYLQ